MQPHPSVVIKQYGLLTATVRDHFDKWSEHTFSHSAKQRQFVNALPGDYLVIDEDQDIREYVRDFCKRPIVASKFNFS